MGMRGGMLVLGTILLFILYAFFVFLEGECCGWGDVDVGGSFGWVYLGL